MTDLVGINLTTQNSADSRLQEAYNACYQLLLNERVEQGHWEGELSTSALSTATAVMALIQVQRAKCSGIELNALPDLISKGIRWLLSERNNDGGWGDTPKSLSNISTTMLVRAVLEITKNTDSLKSMIDESYLRHTDDYIERIGGVAAVRERYGKDRTFSVPILMQAALGGLVDWRDVNQLPFEMACLPANWYKWANLPVVSYALPALIAIGVLKHRKRPTWFLPWRVVRNFSEASALKVLRKIQPTTGGFLEATPLTSFVTMR
ncbi:MAG TPA: squalene--hopene cyclase, partial [Planctomycetaceae bacterium]|nr:squalene--hopene cyclase [Planctomycetaceae bacterium]